MPSHERRTIHLACAMTHVYTEKHRRGEARKCRFCPNKHGPRFERDPDIC
jgi:hypothetical protein